MDNKIKEALAAYDRIMENQETGEHYWDTGIKAGATMIVAALIGWDELRKRDDQLAEFAHLKWLDGR